MARDYSNKGRKKPTGKNKRKKKKGSTPGWTWLLIGLCIGLIAAAVAYIATRPAGQPGGGMTRTEVPQPQKPARSSNNDDTSDRSSEEQQFDFYDMLRKPGSSAENEPAPPPTPGHADKSPSRPSRPSKPSHREDSHYVIQAGAFKTRKSANRRKAELALLGLQSDIVAGKTDSGDAIYRVRSHTIDSNNRLTEMLKRLRKHDIKTLVIREDD